MVIFSQIVQGYFESIYKQNIIHRDLKIESILMKGNIPQICNFEFAQQVDDVQLSIEQSYKYKNNDYQCRPLYEAPKLHLRGLLNTAIKLILRVYEFYFIL
ncbi:hypothetical protein ABPG72_017213 [Tetrahymena utriculariae]